MRSLELQSRYRNTPPLVIEWDQARGRISGRDAAQVYAQIKEWRKDGFIPLVLACSSIPMLPNPLKSPEQFAAIVGLSYVLPDDLEAVYPTIVDDTEDGELN